MHKRTESEPKTARPPREVPQRLRHDLVNLLFVIETQSCLLEVLLTRGDVEGSREKIAMIMSCVNEARQLLKKDACCEQ